METEVVLVAYDGHYATKILKDITDVQELNGLTLFFRGQKLVFGIAVSKLVYFQMYHT